MMGTLNKDLRHGLRIPFHNPALTTVIVLALGIGAQAAIFSMLDALLLEPLPVQRPSSLVMVWEKNRIPDPSVPSPANNPSWKSRNHVFGDLAAVDIVRMNLTGAGAPEELFAGTVSTDFFQLIGVHAVVGRAFLPGEDQRGHDHVAILSHGLWQQRFGGDPGIVGKSITLNGESHQVIGILPPDFSWNNRRTDVWVPYAIGPDRDYRAVYSRAAGSKGRSDSVEI